MLFFKLNYLKIILLFIVSLVFVGTVYAQTVSDHPFQTPEFTIDLNQTSSSGHVKIIWETSQEVDPLQFDFQVQQSRNDAFSDPKVIYQGDDLATYLSGLSNGDYYFRVRLVNGNESQALSSWSKYLSLTVKHHSLTLALWLCALGLGVFCLTVFVLIKGIRDNKG